MRAYLTVDTSVECFKLATNRVMFVHKSTASVGTPEYAHHICPSQPARHIIPRSAFCAVSIRLRDGPSVYKIPASRTIPLILDRLPTAARLSPAVKTQPCCRQFSAIIRMSAAVGAVLHRTLWHNA